MKRIKWQIYLGVILLTCAFFFYFIHYQIFHDLHHIFLYLIGDVAFVFIEVWLVSIVIHELLNAREKREKIKKMEGLMGVFYSEMGSNLVTFLSNLNPDVDDICEGLVVDDMWKSNEFKNAIDHIEKSKIKIEPGPEGFGELSIFLSEKREFLLQLLQNPIILEYEDFASILWELFYITEELKHYGTAPNTQGTYDEMLISNLERVYHLLVKQWLLYMKRLYGERSLLFSLSLRSNPFMIHCDEEE